MPDTGPGTNFTAGAIICMRVGFTVKPTFDTVIIPYTYSYLFSFGLNVVLEGISGGVQVGVQFWLQV